MLTPNPQLYKYLAEDIQVDKHLAVIPGRQAVLKGLLGFLSLQDVVLETHCKRKNNNFQYEMIIKVDRSI